MSIQTDDFAPPPKRVMSAAPDSPKEEALERALRPKLLDDYVGQAKARGLCPAERIGTAIGAIAAQIDHGADAMMPRGQPYLPGQRVVGPVKPARCHHAPIPPAQPQNGVIYEKRIAPGGGGGHALLFQPRA
jgi:hypothetical protein